MNKICTKCKIEKSTDEFYKDKRKSDGLRSWCKSCQKEDNKKREPMYNETRKNYRVKNQDEYRAKKREYYYQNKEKVLNTSANWRKSTLNGRMSSYIRGAQKRNIEWGLSIEEFSSLWGLPCFYCGDKIETIGIDRVDSKKGYNIKNVVPCCTHCNIMKMHYTQKEFLNKIKQIYELQRDRGGFNHINLRGKI